MKALIKARVTSSTSQDLSIESLERRMMSHKFVHEKYDPYLLQETERASIIAILSSN